MAKQSNQKAKLLYLQKILTAETDAEHGITIAGLAEKLAELGIAAERKSLYDDMEVLRGTGMDIATVRGRSNSYKLVGRVPDADAVLKIGRALQAAGEPDADVIMQGLCGFLSRYEAAAVMEALARGADETPEAAQAAELLTQEATPAAQQEAGAAEEKAAAEEEKAAAAEGGEAASAGGGKDDGAAETIELKCSADLQDAVLNYFGAQAQIVKAKSSGAVIKALAVINEDFYVQLIKWGSGVKLSEPSYRRKEFKKYCKKILSQYK